ncbi:MAG: sulfite oxidase [Chloroflexota bacterium]
MLTPLRFPAWGLLGEIRNLGRGNEGVTMPLFVVQHKHAAETCPAGNPQIDPMLLQHIAQGDVAKLGINVRGDAVVDGQHSFYLILETAGADKVQEFMSPFAQMGSGGIWPANACETVANRGHC